jgi:glycosyltransferase involved in cell wall biosynthesis
MNRKKPDHLKARNRGKKKISIMIPTYNSAKTIREAIESAIAQTTHYKEIVVVDDCSKDDTVKIAKEYPSVRVVENQENMGIGHNLANCMVEAKTPYVVFLCGDDVFADSHVCEDIIKIFDEQHRVGVIDRPYYQFMNGHPGAVTRVDEDNIYLSSCCPSGMAFRKTRVWGSNRIFIEMPLIVVQYLQSKWRWVKMTYDTVAVRIHPGGNTGTLSSYYTESPTKLYTQFLGKPFNYYPIFIQLKNRAPKMLWDEIKIMRELNPNCVKDKMFWICAITALIVPTRILQHLSAFYRHRISRCKARIIKRGE